VCCGVDDNPKDTLSQGGTFCGVPWPHWLHERGVQQHLLWPSELSGGDSSVDTPSHSHPPAGGGAAAMPVKATSQSLWHAKLFPAGPKGWGAPLAMWLMGALSEPIEAPSPSGTAAQGGTGAQGSGTGRAAAGEGSLAGAWRRCERVSLAELHERVDSPPYAAGSTRWLPPLPEVGPQTSDPPCCCLAGHGALQRSSLSLRAMTPRAD